MKTYFFVICLMFVTRSSAQQTLRHSHLQPAPYYELSPPQYTSYSWSGQNPPASISTGGAQDIWSLINSPRQVSNGQTGVRSSPPIAYQTLTITDFTSNGTQENRLTSRINNPVDIFNLFKSLDSPSADGSKNVQWKPSNSSVDGRSFQWRPFNGASGGANSFQWRPFNTPFGGANSFQWKPFNTRFGNGTNSFWKPFNTPFVAGSQTFQWSSFNAPSVSKTFEWKFPDSNAVTPAAPAKSSFDFPSSDELNDEWGNKVDDADEEKLQTTRSTGLRQTKKFVQACLDAHNGYRKKHYAPALRYNTQVAKVAQAWASKLIGSIARGGHLQHRPNNKFGENIWMGSGYKFTDEEAVKQAVKSWYDEISLYRPYFGREPNMANFKEWGHFTQVVWKSSSKLGVGIARKNGHILVVANYDPPGNYQGQYANNVRRS
ncbi:hypothetical protein M8J77_014916 [Diaphorina citri]|nr:hypothetical protein M8J77_014916 [Diaphorina citri]